GIAAGIWRNGAAALRADTTKISPISIAHKATGRCANGSVASAVWLWNRKSNFGEALTRSAWGAKINQFVRDRSKPDPVIYRKGKRSVKRCAFPFRFHALVSDLAPRDHRITGRLHSNVDRAAAVGETAAAATVIAIGRRAELGGEVRLCRIGGVVGISGDVGHNNGACEGAGAATVLLKDSVTDD